MDNDTTIQQLKLIMRRFEDTFPAWMIVVPIAGAALLFLLIMVQRPSHAHQSFLGRLASVFNPPWAFLVLAIGCGAYAFLGYQLVSLASWWLVLVPVLAVGLAYVGIMYFRDSKSVGPVWASWLGLLRAVVYLLIAFVFLLPAWQQSTRTERRSRIVIVFDVSASFHEVDEVAEGGSSAKPLRRQEQVLKLLSDDKIAFIDGLLKNNPVTCYRFGKTVDPIPKELANTPGNVWTGAKIRKELESWLMIDPKRKGIDVKEAKLEADLYYGTNLGGAVRQVFEKQSGNMLQGIVVFSDGQSNQDEDMPGSMAGGEQVYDDIRDLARRAKVPIVCVGVGKFKPHFSIRVDDLEAPTSARPDEPFHVNVPVVAHGLKDKEYEVILDLTRIRDADDKVISGEKSNELRLKSKHKEGEADRVEFQIDILALKGYDLEKIKKLEDKERKALMATVEGTWEFRAKVARDKREAFDKAFHTPEQPARVKIQQKKLRVLLFAGGPSKEYQFLRTVLQREAQGQRMEVGVFLQTNKEEEIDLGRNDQDWVLDHFPIHRVRPSPKEMPYTLFEYDAMIALDPDWGALQDEELALVKEWVQSKAGGLIMVAGPVNTYQLRELGQNTDPDSLTPIRDLCPIVLLDSRLQGLGEGFDPSVKYPIKLDGPLGQYDFMKLDEDGKGPAAGWNEFFYASPDPKPSDDLENGFYSYYPARRAKSIATVLATFPVPAGGGGAGVSAQPWIAAAQSSQGNVIYIGSLEMWRLRNYKAKFYQHFWIKIVRYAGQGNVGRAQKFGQMNIADKMLTGDKRRAEYQLRGPDGKLLARDDAEKHKLQVVVMPFKKADDPEPDPDVTTWSIYPLKSKPGGKNEISGWFMAEFPMELAGKYQLRLAHAGKYYSRIKQDEKSELKMKIPGTEEELIKTVLVTQPNPEMDNLKPDLVRLYNLASDNDIVLPRISDDAKKKLRAVKGPIEEGAPTKPRDGRRLYFDIASAPLIPELMIQAKEEKEIKGNTKDLRDEAWDWDFELFDEPVRLAWIMALIVALLSIEWLSRKLLRLA